MLSKANTKKIQLYLTTKPVIKCFLFGSSARNTENRKSDIDLLIDIDYSQNVSLLDFIGWKMDLEKKIGRKIDLVAEDALSKHVKPFIDKEKIMIYEKH